MKTSGIVALAIVVASMEVADAKCYIGHISGYWQGSVAGAVQGGMVYIPTATSKKIMIRGFRTSLTAAGGLGVFYAGIEDIGATLGIGKVAAANTGTAGNPSEYIYIPKALGSTTGVDNTDNGDLTLDLAWVTAVTNFDPAANSVQELFWLALVKHDDVGNTQYAKFDFAPHFRGGSLTGLRYRVSGQILVQDSRSTAVTVPAATWYIGAGSDGQNVRVFIGTMSWASSRDALDALETATDDVPKGVFHLAAGSAGGAIDNGTPRAPTTPANIDGPATITDVRQVKWMAFHDASTAPANGIVGYVTA